MNKMLKKRISFVWMVLVIFTLMTGCGTATADTSSETNETTANKAEEVGTRVNSIESLLDSIAPDALIVVEAGKYNLSEFLENVNEDEWNEAHPYVKVRKMFDGKEFVVQKVNNLSIQGEGASSTEIVIEPRYAAVMNFENCIQISLSGLTMGHTNTGDCSGNVLNFSACSDIILKDLDLYGCGVHGIETWDGTRDFYMYDSTIRECAYGPYYLQNGNGDFEFHNCKFIDSDGCGYFDDYGMRIAFYDCTFGYYETSGVIENDYAEFNNCTFSEDYFIPEGGWEEYDDEDDYGYSDENLDYDNISYENYGFTDEVDKFHLDNMMQASTEVIPVENTFWDTYVVGLKNTGKVYRGSYNDPNSTFLAAGVEFMEDGTGTLTYTYESFTFTWEYTDYDQIWIELSDGRTVVATPYREYNGEEEYDWLYFPLTITTQDNVDEFVFWLEEVN